MFSWVMVGIRARTRAHTLSFKYCCYGVSFLIEFPVDVSFIYKSVACRLCDLHKK